MNFNYFLYFITTGGLYYKAVSFKRGLIAAKKIKLKGGYEK